MATAIAGVDGMRLYRRGGKRIFDLTSAALGLIAIIWVLVPAVLIASIDTRSFGIFRQTRIGRFGRPFTLYKIKTMRDSPGTVLTTASDMRITRIGALFRRFKFDELPQLLNVIAGHMSFVGPRPEVPEYASIIEKEAPEIMELRPGITGPASLKYRNEEDILDRVSNVKQYNDDIIFPDKVNINREYRNSYSIDTDIKCILKTIKVLA